MNSTSTLDPPGDEEVSRPGSGPERPGVTEAPDGTDAGSEASISKDDLFHLLQNSRRRAVLRYLRGSGGPVRMRDVAEQVAAWEHDTTVSGLSSDERQRVYVALYQSHLDTLAEAGVIEYDKSRGVIEPLPLLDRIAAYTDEPVPRGGTGVAGTVEVGDCSDDGTGEASGGEEGLQGSDRVASNGHGGRDSDGDDRSGRADTWGRRYLGVSVAGAVLLAGTALDVAAFQALSGTAAGALVLLTFSALTVAKLTLDGDAEASGTDG